MPPIHVRALSESEYDAAYKHLADELLLWMSFCPIPSSGSDWSSQSSSGSSS